MLPDFARAVILEVVSTKYERIRTNCRAQVDEVHQSIPSVVGVAVLEITRQTIYIFLGHKFKIHYSTR